MSSKKRPVKVKEKPNGKLTAELNEFAARDGKETAAALSAVDSTTETDAVVTTSGASATEKEADSQRRISDANNKLADRFEDNEFQPLDFGTEVPVDSLESGVGYSSLIRQMQRAYVRSVAYHRSRAGGSLPIEEARKQAFHACADREEAYQRFDEMMSYPLDCLSFSDLGSLYAAAPRLAEGFWEMAKLEGRAEFESGHLAANINFPEDYMKGVWNIARYLGVRESFIDDWQPKGGIEIAMVDMLTQSWFQWQYWLEQTVKRSQTRETEVHPEYTNWLEQRGRELKSYGITDGYWNRPYVTEQQAIDSAVQMADRFNRIFMRTLRQLRDLRRYAPVTINNPQQVNIAADSGQQVNVLNKEN